MAGEGILQGIEHVDSETVAVVDVADRVVAGTVTVAGIEEDPAVNEVGVEDAGVVGVADVDIVVVGGH